VSSIEPDGSSRQVDRGQEVPRRLVVPGSDGSELLEFGKEILNPVALFIQFLIQVTWDLTALFRGNDDFLSGFFQRRDTTFVRIEGPVGEHDVSRDGREKGIGSRQIVCLARGQEKVQGTAQSVDHGMNLCGQSAFRASQGLLCLGGRGVLPPFLRAPAAC
jgi:hypothetical protein